MTVFQSLRQGARSLHQARRMLLVFYTAATLPAVVGAAVVMTVPFNSLRHSTWAIALGNNLDASWISELIAQSTVPALPMLAAVVGLVGLACILQVFLLGGTLQIFGVGEPFTAAAFFGGCGRHFWRLVRLALFSVIFFAVSGAIGVGLKVAGLKIWGESSEASPLIYWSWFRAVVLACLLGLCSLAWDYAAIRLALEDSRKSVRAYLAAFRFIWRAPFRTMGLYIVLWLVVLLFLGAYAGVSRLVPQTSLALIFLLFLVRQATVLAKVWCRLLFYSAQCALYQHLRPSPVPGEPAPGPEPEPVALVGPELEPLKEPVPPTEPDQVLPEAPPDRTGTAHSES
jgi:hypothetical protein